MEPTRILVADSLPLFSDALATALGLQPDLDVFNEYPASGPAVIEAAQRLQPDVALVDFWLPGLEQPLLVKGILEKAERCKVILLSWISGSQHIEQGLQAGAAGFISKEVSAGQLVEVIRRTLKEAKPIGAHEVVELLQERAGASQKAKALFENLTPRQAEILGMLDGGRTSQQIADQLGVSFKTVRNHISELLLKTETPAVSEALAKARRCGFFAKAAAPPREP